MSDKKGPFDPSFYPAHIHPDYIDHNAGEADDYQNDNWSIEKFLEARELIVRLIAIGNEDIVYTQRIGKDKKVIELVRRPKNGMAKIFFCRIFDGESLEEIGDKIGEPFMNVYQRYQVFVKQLRKKIEPEDVGMIQDIINDMPDICFSNPIFS